MLGRTGFVLFGVMAAWMLLGCAAWGGEAPGKPEDVDYSWRAIGLGFSAALAIGLSIMGSAYAVAKIGSAALGAITEKPHLLASSILFVALAEGLAVLGFAVAIMLLQKI